MKTQHSRLGIQLYFSNEQRLIRVNWVVLAIFIALEYLSFSLGMWQLDRAEEKQRLTDEREMMNQQPPLNLNFSDTDQLVDYQLVHFSAIPIGETTVFLANEPNQGQDGYHILNPVILNETQLIWINRGWIPANGDRRVLPIIQPLPTEILVEGLTYFSKGSPLLFDHALQQTGSEQWLLQGLDFGLLNSVVNASQYERVPYIIRLTEQSEHGFVREWQWISMPPEKHIAYAVQWFGFATALVILGLLVSVRKRELDNGF